MDKIKYVNHLNQEIDLFASNSTGDFIVGSFKEARHYSYSQENDMLFIEPKTWSALIACSSKSQADNIVSIFETDSCQNENGKFYFNDWYIETKFLGISDIVFESENFIKLSVSFLSYSNEWSKESFVTLVPNVQKNDSGLNFAFNFPYNYSGSSVSIVTLRNDSLLEADFKMSFEGTDKIQTVKIGRNDYSVNNIIKKGESFFLDTQKKTVFKSTPNGTVDLFAASSDTDYIFEKLKKGDNLVTWNTSNKLHFTIIEHRRIPPWI